MDSLSSRLASPEGAVCSYAGVNYRQHYVQLLRRHPAPAEAIAELGLFRFWLACRACSHAAGDDDAMPLQWPAGWPLPRHVAGFDVEYVLGARLNHLLDSRCDLYDRFFLLGRNADDPLGLDAAALALACQLFVDPPMLMRHWLRLDVHAVFEHVLRCCTPR